MTYSCCDDRRREAVRRQCSSSPGGPYLNGIDYLEVVDSEAVRPEDRQRLLRVHTVNPLLAVVGKGNVRIDGGERIRNIHVTGVAASVGARVIEVNLDQWGDFSRYTLRLLNEPASGGGSDQPLDGFDRQLAAVDFTFKVECPSDFDCAPAPTAVTGPPSTLDIDYLARDYAGLRRLMLDRIMALVPGWRERHAADMGVALVELLAYAGDYLAYRQDAIATEAYLGTARQRRSLRRHARLVDYVVDDGASARVWVQLRVVPGADPDPFTVPATPELDSPARPLRFLTRTASQWAPGRIAPDSTEEKDAIAAGVEVFELAEPDGVVLTKDHNELQFYAWGARGCCLPKGATSATLVGAHPNLHRGDVLVLAERVSPGTGRPDDADPSHRCVVRLAADAVVGEDPLFAFLGDSPSGSGPVGPFAVTDVAWYPADALPFPLCISADTTAGYRDDLSVALGNIVLASQGATVPRADVLSAVPTSSLTRVLATGHDCCAVETDEERLRRFVPPRYSPALAGGPLSRIPFVTVKREDVERRVPYDRDQPAANVAALTAAPLPEIVLVADPGGERWRPQIDLLSSDADAAEFVVELEGTGSETIRFGDDALGRRPNSGAAFEAFYRVGCGARGNVGADGIGLVVSADDRIDWASNPLPAFGGRDPESIEEIRQRAPVAFRFQERAVTEADYAAVAERHPEVQRAIATFRWTGSWRTVFLTVDRIGRSEVDESFKTELRALLEPYRMAGHDVEVEAPIYVPLELDMAVCVKPDYFRSQVEAALLNVFSNRTLADGRRGMFHPDDLTFGQTIYLSRLYAAAQAVQGVASVEIGTLQRQGVPSSEAIQTGALTLNRLEIARLDNDPSFPDRGVFRLTVEGGK